VFGPWFVIQSSLNMPSWLTDMATVLTMLGIALLLWPDDPGSVCMCSGRESPKLFPDKGFVRIANLLSVINGSSQLKAMSGF